MTRDFLIQWNYQFPVDRWWRLKHNIPLFSKSHLEVSQVDIMMEYMEDKLFDELVEERENDLQVREQYKIHGIFMKKEVLTPQREEELFSKLDISSKNKEEQDVRG